MSIYERWSREAKEREAAVASVTRLMEYPTPREIRFCGTIAYRFQRGRWANIGIVTVAFNEEGAFCNVPDHHH